ncbi:MAG: hypothetical protein KatS3mg131_3628 [Candidatus Tectimicrobiota bacterium]|nr:MAG: hypothetical protein KatS3mg131_3628 [Candidatus Tectomicrobia bacterium]
MSVSEREAGQGTALPAAVPGEARSLRYITPEDLQARLASGQPPVILDVRREEGYAQQPYQIPGALRFSLDVRPPVVPSLPRTTPLVVYCT